MVVRHHLPNLSMTGCGASLDFPKGEQPEDGDCRIGANAHTGCSVERTGEPGCRQRAGVSPG